TNMGTSIGSQESGQSRRAVHSRIGSFPWARRGRSSQAARGIATTRSGSMAASGIVFVGDRFVAAGQAAGGFFDPGLPYGDGIFEGIRAYHGRVFKLSRHIERLFDSAHAIRLDIPFSPAEMINLVLETCRLNEIVDGYIRLVVTRGAGALGI